MTSTIHDGLGRAPAARAQRRTRTLTPSLPRPELMLLLVISGALYLWALSRNGYANDYYAAAVRSMASSWHNFLFGSLDPAGVMTVDKPPLALWVQALSARIFGFHSLSLLVPQALMGMATVGLVYDLTARRWGRAGGFAAGAVLALTPITVAISRHNNPDALLILCVVGALWAVVRGLEDGRTRWLVIAGVCVGLGFEAKMGAALLVVPALAVAWLWVAPKGRVKALGQLAAGGAAMIVVGGAWPLLVALTPAGSRPWISGTSDNSIVSLILDYNGVGRLDGQAGGPGGLGGGSVFGGSTGVLRLLNSSLGGQAGWLLGFSLVSGIALVVATRLRRSDPGTGWLLATGGSALTTAVAFSTAKGIFHPYYVSELAPFTAALAGAGVGRFTRGDTLARVAAPLAIAGGVLTEVLVLRNDSTSLVWLPPILIAGGLLAAGALAMRNVPRVRNAAIAGVLGLLLIAPAAWSVQTLGHATSSTFPAGGPASAGGFGGGPGGGGGGRGFGGGGQGGPPNGGGAPGGGFGGPGGAGAAGGTTGGTGGTTGGGATGGTTGTTGGGATAGRGGFTRGGFGGGGAFGQSASSLTSVLAYIKANGGGSLAVSSQSTAASAILASNANVVGLGGFSGSESDPTISWLASEVAAGKIRWVLADTNGGMGRDGRTGSTTVMSAIAQTCKAVTVNGVTIYDCQGYASALAALA